MFLRKSYLYVRAFLDRQSPERSWLQVGRTTTMSLARVMCRGEVPPADLAWHIGQAISCLATEYELVLAGVQIETAGARTELRAATNG